MDRKNRVDVLIDKNSVVDKGDGTVEFKGGLTLSDESVQKSGTRYDIKSMDISQYDGTVFADHDYSVNTIVGKSFGVSKSGKKLVAKGVNFAVQQSPLANFVYQMVTGGFINAVSIGTIGQLDTTAEDDKNEAAWGIYRNARLIEWSFVGIGNNDHAVINSIAQNVYEDAKSNGLDTKELETFVNAVEDAGDEPEPAPAPKPKVPTVDGQDASNNSNEDDEMKFITIKNGRKMAVPVSYKNASGEETTTELAPGASVDVSEDQQQAVEKQITDAVEPKEETDKNDVSAIVKNAVEAAVKPLQDQVTEMDKQLFNKGAKEPEFAPAKNGAAVNSNEEFAGMDWKELTQNQIQAFWDATRGANSEAATRLAKLNEYNKAQLVEKGVVSKNSLGASDFGNFVTNPELITEIQGYRSDYSDLLGVFTFQETNSLKMAWLKRNGDIDMQPVGLEPTDISPNANLKPVSEYGATMATKDLEELAAVTPVCNSATIFLAADLLGDVAQGYRHSYDRNLARGVVAALEQAAETNSGASLGYTAGGVTTANDKLEQIRLAIFAISQGDGVLIMNEASYGIIWSLLTQTGNGAAVVDVIQNGLSSTTLWKKRLVLVPNDLLPTLGLNDYKTYSYEGSTVTVNHAIYYANPVNFRGRQNGGLRYDLSAEAAYEQGGQVKSSFQRNEIVLRGSMFRGSAVLDATRVGAVRSQNIIS